MSQTLKKSAGTKIPADRPSLACHLATSQSAFLSSEFPIATPAGQRNFSQPQYFSGFRIDQVHPCACRAGNRFISLSFVCGWVISEPALNVQGRVGASVEKCRHSGR